MWEILLKPFVKGVADEVQRDEVSVFIRQWLLKQPSLTTSRRRTKDSDESFLVLSNQTHFVQYVNGLSDWNP